MVPKGSSTAQENEKCECDILQVSESGEITNFTKQSGEINGRPFFFKITSEERNEIVWWNDTSSSWMIQNYARDFSNTISEVKNDTDCPNFSNTEDWFILSNRDNNDEIRSRCLTDKNKCQVIGEF